MSLTLYLVYIFAAFSIYMLWVLGSTIFVEVIVPWLVFMAVIFAPLVWFANFLCGDVAGVSRRFCYWQTFARRHSLGAD